MPQIKARKVAGGDGEVGRGGYAPEAVYGTLIKLRLGGSN